MHSLNPPIQNREMIQPKSYFIQKNEEVKHPQTDKDGSNDSWDGLTPSQI